MMNMEVGLEKEYELYFGGTVQENGRLNYTPNNINTIEHEALQKEEINISNKTSYDIAKELIILDEQT